MHIKEGSEEKDDVVKDDLKQKQKEPKKGLLSNGVSVSVREDEMINLAKSFLSKAMFK